MQDDAYRRMDSPDSLQPVFDDLNKSNVQLSYSRKYLMMTLLALPLGIPDGVTYSHFGFEAGESLAGYLNINNTAGINFFRYLVGIGAPMGVYCFAVNNLMRELLYFVSSPEDYTLLSHPNLRKISRYSALVLASVSMIPFAGMSMNAASGFGQIPYYLLVFSNSFARFCMNDYALRSLFEKVLNNYLISWDSLKNLRRLLLQQLQRQCNDIYQGISSFPIQNNFSNQEFYFGLESKCLEIMDYTTPKWQWILDAVGYFVGAVTATYLYSFAVEASEQVTGVDGSTLNNFLAIMGVIPTMALWADDSMTGIRVIVMSVYHRLSIKHPENSIVDLYRKVIPMNKLRVVAGALGIGVAGLGAYSESKMAYETVAGDWGFYAVLLKICTIPAFSGIYITSALQLTNKLINKFGVHFLNESQSEKVKLIEKFDRAFQLVEKLDNNKLLQLSDWVGCKQSVQLSEKQNKNLCSRITQFFSFTQFWSVRRGRVVSDPQTTAAPA